MGNHRNVTTRNEKRRLSGSSKRVKRRGWGTQVKWSGLLHWIEKVLRKQRQGELERAEWSGVGQTVSQRGCRQGRLICRQQAELAERPGHRPRT